jgi:hypothetical protein
MDTETEDFSARALLLNGNPKPLVWLRAWGGERIQQEVGSCRNGLRMSNSIKLKRHTIHIQPPSILYTFPSSLFPHNLTNPPSSFHLASASVSLNHDRSLHLRSELSAALGTSGRRTRHLHRKHAPERTVRVVIGNFDEAEIGDPVDGSRAGGSGWDVDCECLLLSSASFLSTFFPE